MEKNVHCRARILPQLCPDWLTAVPGYGHSCALIGSLLWANPGTAVGKFIERDLPSN